MKIFDYLKVFILRTIGNFLLLSAIVGVVLTFAPAVQAEITYRYNAWVGQRYLVIGDPNPCEKGQLIKQGDKLICLVRSQNSGFISLFGSQPTPLAMTPVDPNFDIIVPKIGANSRVIANVDPGNTEAYLAALKLGVAHAAGTVFPGQVGNSFLFAHSVGNFWDVSRWNAVFYLLKELNPGDEVDIFYQGKRLVYTVYDKKIVDASETQYLSAVANFPMLTLQTCWPPGTTLKRLLVFARLRQGFGG